MSRRPPGRAGARKGTRQSPFPFASARRERSRAGRNDAPSSFAHAACRPAGGTAALDERTPRRRVRRQKARRSGEESLRGIARRGGGRERAPHSLVRRTGQGLFLGGSRRGLEGILRRMGPSRPDGARRCGPVRSVDPREERFRRSLREKEGPGSPLRRLFRGRRPPPSFAGKLPGDRAPPREPRRRGRFERIAKEAAGLFARDVRRLRFGGYDVGRRARRALRTKRPRRNRPRPSRTGVPNPRSRRNLPESKRGRLPRKRLPRRRKPNPERPTRPRPRRRALRTSAGQRLPYNRRLGR